MAWYVWLPLALVFVVAALSLARLLWLQHRERHRLRAQARFLQMREHLEAEFFTAAAQCGKPRGLRWMNCEWEPEVAFARERDSGQLAALVAVTIRFEAVPGGDMEGLPAVGNLRNASAVFFFDRGRWRTTGKTVFNLNPGEAIDRFQGKYERVGVN